MVCLLVALLQDPAAPPTTQTAPATSLERIRRGLEEPVAPFEGTATFRPVFRITVRERMTSLTFPWEEPLKRPAYAVPRQPIEHYNFLATVTPEEFRAATLHPIGVDLLSVFRWLHKGVQRDARSRAERKAREEVQRELREFLAARSSPK